MYENEAVVRAIMAERIREANHARLTHAPRRRERTTVATTAATAAQEPQRHSRLWSLAHLGRAYG